MYDVAYHATNFANLEAASWTFNAVEAIDLMLAASAGSEIDRERLDRLLEVFHVEPQLEPHYDYESGAYVYVNEQGEEAGRYPVSPEDRKYFQWRKDCKQMMTDFVETTAPRYVTLVLLQLKDPQATEATVSTVIKRGQNDDLVSRNELEQAALNRARQELKQRGLIVRDDNRRVGEDGLTDHPKSRLTYTKRTLIITRPE